MTEELITLAKAEYRRITERLLKTTKNNHYKSYCKLHSLKTRSYLERDTRFFFCLNFLIFDLIKLLYGHWLSN